MTMIQPLLQDEIIPERYIVMAFTQRCQCCRAIHQWSELYALANIRPFWNAGRKVTNLHRIDQPKYDLPIEVRRQPEKLIPFCHSCNEPTLHDLPRPPTSAKQFLGNLTEALKPVPIKSTSTTKPKSRPTLADLAELLK